MNCKSNILVKGCREHNLKNLSLTIPKESITAIVGVSGAGKSSLAFDVLFAEAQRRYLECFSLKGRGRLKMLPKPDVDWIEGLPPALAVQTVPVERNRTLAEQTDLYDYLVLTLVHLGKQHSPMTGKLLFRDSRQEIIEKILKEYPLGQPIQLLAPLFIKAGELSATLFRLQSSGFVRVRIQDEEQEIADLTFQKEEAEKIEVVIDRLVMKEGVRERLSDSIEAALNLSEGIVKVQEGRQGPIKVYSELYVCEESEMRFEPLSQADFNRHSAQGACPHCQGKGMDLETERPCSYCQGTGLKEVSLSLLVHEKNIAALLQMTTGQLLSEIQSWRWSSAESEIAMELLPQLMSRLELLETLTLGYVALNRRLGSLSSGECARVQFASHIGAKLSGMIYILDEPSSGLHPQDLKALFNVIRFLKELGNTLVLVEHEKSLILSADYLIELGPGAGKQGGFLLCEGSLSYFLEASAETGAWLAGKKPMPLPKKRRKGKGYLQFQGVKEHNLKNLEFQIPLKCFVGLCGVSGSGKSTLAFDVMVPYLRGKQESVQRLVVMEKKYPSPSPRSIPATLVGIMNLLRELFAQTKVAKARGYSAARFSLNVKGGRCEACQGGGQMRVQMAFMPDLYLPCDVCGGKRFNFETLQVRWQDKTIAEILQSSVEEVYPLFSAIPGIEEQLRLMMELGVGYLLLGQPANTLSGGEIQRLQLARELSKSSEGMTLYLLDEPSAGLHFQDREKLIHVLQRLVDRGDSVVIIEHQLDMLLQADWLIELGPKGGEEGGYLVFQGSPEKLVGKSTPTGQALEEARG